MGLFDGNFDFSKAADNVMSPLGLAAANLARFDSGGINMPAAVAAVQEFKQAQQDRTLADAQKNETAEYLRRVGREDLAQGIELGAMDSETAFRTYQDELYPDLTANQRDWQYAQENPGYADFLRGPSGGGSSSFSQTPVFLTDPDGNQHIGQISSSGGLLVNGELMPGLPQDWSITARPDNFSSVDMGSGYGTFDPNTGTFSGPQVPRSGAPSQNQDVQLQPDGSRIMTPAQGSPENIEMERTRSRAATSLQSYEQQQGLVLQDINRAVTLANSFPVNGVFSILEAVPGTPQADVAELITTIEANVGFAELNEMRANSPTGGALGQVTERELALLTATLGSLRQRQSREQFIYNLNRLAQQLEASGISMRDAFNRDFGSAQTAPAGQGGGSQEQIFDAADFFR